MTLDWNRVPSIFYLRFSNTLLIMNSGSRPRAEASLVCVLNRPENPRRLLGWAIRRKNEVCIELANQRFIRMIVVCHSAAILYRIWKNSLQVFLMFRRTTLGFIPQSVQHIDLFNRQLLLSFIFVLFEFIFNSSHCIWKLNYYASIW